MRKPTVVVALIIAAACTDRTPVAPDLGGPSASISDAVHEGGNAHFYFLTPLVASPLTSGTFDGSLLPFIVVEVCRLDPSGCTGIAHFTATSTVTCGPKDATPPASGLVRVVAEDEAYIVNWDTGECPTLDAASTYRITVRVAGTELGHADLDVVESGAGLRNVDTQEFVGLVDGRTLPIKFRIETGAVFVIGPDGGMVVAGSGQVVLHVPQGAVASAIGITVAPAGAASEDEGTIPGTLWEFGPEGTEFAIPAELTILYDASALPLDLADPTSSLVLVTQEDGEWSESPAAVHAEAQTVTALVFGFSAKAIAEKTVGMDVSHASLTLAPSATFHLTASARGSRGKVLRKRAVEKLSLDPRIVTIDEVGGLHAVAPGATIVRLRPRLPRRFPPGFCPPFAGCLWPGRDIPVVVRLPVASVTVSPANASIPVGGTVQLAVALRDVDGNLVTDRDVTWTSGATELASVDAAGLVTGLAPGSAVIHAASEGVTGSAEIEVTAAAPPARCHIEPGPTLVGCPSDLRLVLVPSTLTLELGAVAQFQATLISAEGSVTLADVAFRWTSSAPKTVAVDSEGRVTGRLVGTASITAEALEAATGTSLGLTGTGAATVQESSLSGIWEGPIIFNICHVDGRFPQSDPRFIVCSDEGPFDWRWTVFSQAGHLLMAGASAVPPMGSLDHTVVANLTTGFVSVDVDVDHSLTGTLTGLSTNQMSGILRMQVGDCRPFCDKYTASFLVSRF